MDQFSDASDNPSGREHPWLGNTDLQ